MQSLCRDANMPYVNVTLDLGAAMNAYKLIWNYSEKFANVVIHLGDFHFMNESFNNLRMLVQGSGFEYYFNLVYSRPTLYIVLFLVRITTDAGAYINT